MTLDELLALWNDETARAEMTAEQLDELQAALQDRARELLEGERTDAVLADLDELAVTVEAVASLIEQRAVEATEREQRADDLASRIFGQDGEGEGEDAAAAEGEDAAGEEGTEGEGEEGEQAVETPVVEAVAEEQQEPIAAAAGRYVPRVTRVAARRPESSRPRVSTPTGTLVASANVGGGFAAGTPLESPEDLSEAFIHAWNASEGHMGARQQISVARGGGQPEMLYGDERYLTSDARGNSRKIAALTSREAIRALPNHGLVASGGACIPPPVQYDLPIIQGTEARPTRDTAMVRFGADRGGVVTIPPPQLTDISSSVSDWSMLNDVTPGSHGNATKPCLTVTCPDDTTDSVGAIVRCMKFGNFRSRFFGEQVQAWLDLAAVWQARHAERLLIKAIGDGSTQVTSGQVLGTTRDVLATLDRVTAAFRSRHRAPDLPLRFAAPDWLREQISSDIARQIPVGTLDETLAVADASIERWLAARGLNVTWLFDGETGQEFGPQGDGPATGWPDTVVTYLYPEGSWLFLDGGMFDFGVVRDSTLNATNDFEVFAETLEGSHFHGVESLRLELDVCPDGSTSLGIDINPCGVGS